MSDITNQDIKDLKDLILALDRKFDQRFAEVNLQFAEMDKKNELRFAEMDKKMEVGFTELKGEIKRIDQKFDGVDKRLIAEEGLSRNVFVALVVAVLGAGVKYFLFPSSTNI
jgi:hypothetical protein